MMRYQLQPLGGILDVATAAAAVATDPCLPDVATQLLRLRDLQAGKAVAGLGALGATATSSKGIGLCYIVKPLRAVVWARQNPWIAAVGAVAIVGGLVGLGWALRGASK